MQNLDPKKLFLVAENPPGTWKQIAAQDAFKTAVTAAFAQYANKLPPQERLAGASDFIDLLLTLGNVDVVAPRPSQDKPMMTPEERERKIQEQRDAKK